MEKIKSVCASGRKNSFWVLLPRSLPKMTLNPEIKKVLENSKL